MKKILTILATLIALTSLATAFENKNFLPDGSKYVCIVTKEYANGKWNEYTDRQLMSAAKVRLAKFTSTEIVLGEDTFDFANTHTDSDGDKIDIYRTIKNGYSVDLMITPINGKVKKLFKFMLAFDKPGLHSKVLTCVDMNSD